MKLINLEKSSLLTDKDTEDQRTQKICSIPHSRLIIEWVDPEL